ncbi:hypothetical protein CASFOL_016248 [Castilleja foliolosa]|uniref:DPP6 N-terminal domain-like protein n=1 Tax=Castilleja foliolosa TaxID=1961234 RepID=A0ABD3DG19_9LAMI
MDRQIPFIFLISSLIIISFSFLRAEADHGSIAFATWLRPSYSFDIYSLPTSGPPQELRLTDGVSVNFNGQFPAPSSVSMLPHLPNHSLPTTHLVYVTERNGSSSVYLDSIFETPLVSSGVSGAGHQIATESIRIEYKYAAELTRSQVLLIGDAQSDDRISMKDRPSLVGENLVYISTHEDPDKPRASWTAVYSTHLLTGSTRRLTPPGVADFSPAVSPSGAWTAVASYGENGWQGEIEDLNTDIYVFSTRDGSKRVRIIEHGGWPSWANDSTLYFHRSSEDGWWGVFRASFNTNDGEINVDSVMTQRVTPPGLHAFTPAASVANPGFIAVATRRPESEYRHVELYDVLSNRFIMSTLSVTPNAHHYNPFISPDSKRVGYHKCKGSTDGTMHNDLVIENIKGPIPDIPLFQVDGSFPSYSPDGAHIAFVKLTTEPKAYVDSPGLYVMNSDGTGVRAVLTRPAFATAWDWKRKGVVYTSVGPIFASESSKVDIISINVDDEHPRIKTLTHGGENNVFPSPSPDGKWVVFRSGRSGYKNLYIMDAINGETGGLHKLTDGPWTDTMCNWSPDGEWIAFSSDRENPGLGSFELFKIHPNGTGLQKVLRSGSGGRINHPWFSPDGKHIVLVSDFAGVSAEPISNPHHFQPYGDVFVIKSDGSGIRRLTHNSYEDGTPTWGPGFEIPTNAEWPNDGSHCSLEDSHWPS